MKTTWNDIKQAVWKLMFLSENETAEYEAYLYDAANYALIEIAAQVQPIIKTYEIAQMPLGNLGPAQQREFDHEREDVTLTVSAYATAYTFETNGSGTCTITCTDGSAQTIALTSDGGYKTYKGFFNVHGAVRMTFSGTFAYHVMNLAVYASVFGSEESDIPAFGRYNRYDMVALTNDALKGRMFLSFMEDMPAVRQSFDAGSYEVPDYFTEQGSVIWLNAQQAGRFEVLYKQYPTKITADTADGFEPEITPEAARLVPLLMAWRMLKDDDERKAILYFNEYQNAKAGMMRGLSVSGSAQVWEA